MGLGAIIDIVIFFALMGLQTNIYGGNNSSTKMLNIAIIGKVSVGKSSFINSFVQTPVAAAALQRETIVPVRYVFDPKVPRAEIKRRPKNQQLPTNLNKIETRKVFGITLAASITDYPGLDDANDPRDILGALIEKLAEYDIIMFLIDASSPFVSKSESELFERLRVAVKSAYARGVCVKLITVVTKYVDWDQDIVDIVRENTRKMPDVFRWNAFNSIMCAPNDFRNFSEWNKISKIGRVDKYDFDNLRGYLKNYSVVESKKSCEVAYHASCDSWERFSAAVAFGLQKEKGVVLGPVANWVMTKKNCPLQDATIQTSLLVLKRFYKIDAWLGERISEAFSAAGWCNKSFCQFIQNTGVGVAAPQNIHFEPNIETCKDFVHLEIIRCVLVRYLERELNPFTLEKIVQKRELMVAVADKSLDAKIHEFITANAREIVNSDSLEIILMFPKVFPYPEVYSDKYPVKITPPELEKIIRAKLLPLNRKYTELYGSTATCNFCFEKSNTIHKCVDQQVCKRFMCIVCYHLSNICRIKRLVGANIDVVNSYSAAYFCSAQLLQQIFPDDWFKFDLSKDSGLERITSLVGVKGWEFLHYLNCGEREPFDKKMYERIIGGMRLPYQIQLPPKYSYVSPDHSFLQWCYTHLNTPITLKELWVWVK